MKIINVKTDSLFVQKFVPKTEECWVILGANQSGMEEFFQLLSGRAKEVSADILDLPENPGIISFKTQQALYESELKKDETDFLGKIDPGTPAKQFLSNIKRHSALIQTFGLASCLDKGYRQLSSGQARKLLLLSQFTKTNSCIMIESPFDGLDIQSCKELNKALYQLHKQKILLILFIQNRDDIPSFSTHIGIMENYNLSFQGLKDEVMAKLPEKILYNTKGFNVSTSDLTKNKNLNLKTRPYSELVYLNRGFAGYNGKNVFENLSLTIKTGDHTLVSGPNGSGKSTLLQIISGYHSACYQNDLRIFGIQRGSGESIWDLKKDMGIVSSELHRSYHVPGTALHCVISGYFDSIGIYQSYTHQQKAEALKWLERINLIEQADKSFRDLSYSNQRMVLISRAVIKLPKLLILDEPTQGIDEINRNVILDFLAEIAKEKLCTILYVSHREDEFRDFFIQHIKLGSENKY
ncbi:MAG: ATP-binding cassette domain-containing protein [Thermodesulfobacteriota bacterium]